MLAPILTACQRDPVMESLGDSRVCQCDSTTGYPKEKKCFTSVKETRDYRQPPIYLISQNWHPERS